MVIFSSTFSIPFFFGPYLPPTMRRRGPLPNTALNEARSNFYERYGIVRDARPRIHSFLTTHPAFLNSLRSSEDNWSPAEGVRNRLRNLVVNGTTGQSNTLIIRRDPNATAVSLQMMRDIVENNINPGNRRFVMTVTGANEEGQSRRIVRNISPDNAPGILSIAAAALAQSSNVGADTLASIPTSGSDPEIFNEFGSLTNITSVRITAVEGGGGAAVQDEGEEAPPYQLSSSSSSSQVHPAIAAAVAIDDAAHIPIAPRRSTRVRQATRFYAPGTGTGAFFRYWLHPSFPDSLSFLQVYKQDEQKELMSGFTTEINSRNYELGCLANAFLCLNLPDSKMFQLFEMVSGTMNPNFPTCRLPAVAEELGINIYFCNYNALHVTKGRKVVKYYHDPKGKDGVVYYLGRIENHFFADVESDWILPALRNYSHYQKFGGKKFDALPLEKKKTIIKMRTYKNTSGGEKKIGFRHATPRAERASYGEVLSVLTYGYECEKVHPLSGTTIRYKQEPMVIPMKVEELCFKAELYHFFDKELSCLELPKFESEKENNQLIKRCSREIAKPEYYYLDGKAFSLGYDFGEISDSVGNSPYNMNKPPHYPSVDRLVKQRGIKITPPYLFKDRHALECSVPADVIERMFEEDDAAAASTPTSNNSSSSDDDTHHHHHQPTPSPPKKKKVRWRKKWHTVMVRRAYTFVAIDSETCISPNWKGFQVIGSGEDDENALMGDEMLPTSEYASVQYHRPYMFCVSWVEVKDSVSGKFRLANFADDFSEELDDKDFLNDGSKSFMEGIERKYVGMTRIQSKTFVGYDCAIAMSKFFGSKFFRNVRIHVLAHNARYDLNMWVQNSFAVISEGIFRSSARMNCCVVKVPLIKHYRDESIYKDIEDRTIIADEVNECTNQEDDEDGTMFYYTAMGERRLFQGTEFWDDGEVEIFVQCSLAVTGIPLSAFGKTFGLNTQKEYMPYSLYTQDSLFHYSRGLNARGFPEPDFGVTVDVSTSNAWKIAGAPSCEDFCISVRNAEAFSPSYPENHEFYLWEYARYYCLRDCEVLLKGFLNFRYEMYQIRIPPCSTLPSPPPQEDWEPCGLLLEHAVSLPQFASHYFGICGVFDGVNEFKGTVSQVMRRSLVGGKSMLAANSPNIFFSEDVLNENNAVDDLDTTSLYPSAMVEIQEKHGGIPKGNPKSLFFEPNTCFQLPEVVERDAQYFIAVVRIWKLGKPLLFPVVSGPLNAFPVNGVLGSLIRPPAIDEPTDEDDLPEIQRKLFSAETTRHFTNHPEGANLAIDKITYEDIMDFHEGAKIEFLQILYWPKKNGTNGRIGDVIKYLFSTRLELVKEGRSAAANARKLTMNSAYGRLLMKPPNSKSYFVEGQQTIIDYVARHSNSMKSADLIRNNFAVVERRKGVDRFFNATHIGVFILGISKRIMHRVMTLAENLFFHPTLPLPMFYTDTDSIHIQRKIVIPLFKAYVQKYGEKILTRPGEPETEYSYGEKWLGRFTSDFEGEKGKSPPYSIAFMGVRKKVYIDLLASWDENIPHSERTLENIYYGQHFRMKGIPSKCIQKHCEETITELKESVFDVYQNLFMGKTYSFDLSKFTTQFEMTKSFGVRTTHDFKRTAKIDHKQILLAAVEWVKNGWGIQNFPFLRSYEYLRAELQRFKSAPPFSFKNLGYHVSWEMFEEQGKQNFLSLNDHPHFSPTFPPPPPPPPSPIIPPLPMMEEEAEAENDPHPFFVGEEEVMGKPLSYTSPPFQEDMESFTERMCECDVLGCFCIDNIDSDSFYQWNLDELKDDYVQKKCNKCASGKCFSSL